MKDQYLCAVGSMGRRITHTGSISQPEIHSCADIAKSLPVAGSSQLQ